jgi:hypothetical protein
VLERSIPTSSRAAHPIGNAAATAIAATLPQITVAVSSLVPRLSYGAAGTVRPVALHATTIRFADRGYTAIARAADAQGISVSQYVREAALIRVVLDELDSASEALHTAHDLLAIAREVRRLAEVEPPGPPEPTPVPGLRDPALQRGANTAQVSTRLPDIDTAVVREHR